MRTSWSLFILLAALSAATAHLYAPFAAISIICTIPILILLLVPKSIPKSVERCLVAFGVGSLLGDMFLHLAPQVFGDIKEHQHGDADLSTGLLMLGGFLGFFFVERIMAVAVGGHHHHDHHSHSHGPTKSDKSESSDDSKYADVRQGVLIDSDDDKTKKSNLRQRKFSSSATPESVSDNNLPSILPYKRDSHVHEHSHQELQRSSTAYLALLANFIHSLTDGLVIALSFYTSISTGISTSFAVFFHEVPHRVGDYALLLSQGFTRKKAITAQILLCSGTFLGGGLGTIISLSGKSENYFLSKVVGEHVDELILPITAGGLLYICTVGVIPDLLECGERGLKGARQLVLEMLAIFLGVWIMALVALNE
ncbi:Zinc/iron permease [Paraphysoderma sedebokerense]|nr:Zinc/iron permease [Paraphysoderma sedebokerense]